MTTKIRSMPLGLKILQEYQGYDWDYLFAICDKCSEHRGCDECPSLADCRRKWDKKADKRY